MFGHLPGPSVCCQRAAQVYRAHFCGLSTCLHRQYGAWARWLVNRDSTFLALLGSALAEHEPPLRRTTCCNAFAAPRYLLADGPMLQYTAAVTLCGLSAKLEDDAHDETGWRHLIAKIGNRALDGSFASAVGLLHAWHFPVAQVRASLARQNRIERSTACLQECAQPTGWAYGEIVAHLGEVVGAPAAKSALRQLGANLGFLIYTQDAWDDWTQDVRRGRFNPLLAFSEISRRRAALLPALETALTGLRAAFDRLPLLRHRDLLRGVLLEGAGQRVEQVGKDEASTKRPESFLEKEGRRKNRCWDCCDCPTAGCDCARCGRVPKRSGSKCDCNPCDGDGIECCGWDCSC